MIGPEKTCLGCGLTMPREHFRHRKTRGKLYPAARCDTCRLARRRQERAKASAKQPRKRFRFPVRFDADLGLDVKRCTRCRIEKPLEQFYPRGGRRSAWCKECARVDALSRQHAAPDRWRAYALRYREQNLEKAKASQRAWRGKNYAHVLDLAARRRARARNAAAVETISRAAIIARDGGVCYLCGGKPTGYALTLDHVAPLARGGPHTAANLRVACRSCNSRKNDHLLSELDWYTGPLYGEVKAC
jgi:5-methylcytosine-specific restriction endonuclease McrA